MVAKMQYVSITGHIAGMSHAISRYLSRYDIQLEQARHALMRPFTTLNPYAQTLQKAERFAEIAGEPPLLRIPIQPAEAVNLVETVASAFENHGERLRELEESLTTLRRYADILQNFTSLDIDLSALRAMQFFKFRFGRLTLENFRRLEKFSHNDTRFDFHSASRDTDYVYGVYFVPVPVLDEVDALFVSLGFEVFEVSSWGENLFL
ncbi:MAG: hypothetical protein FWF80_02395, partial [Defluviitaleaceae bacterium]|nr:hypothetical protein [Defluviitaleaceae bacterium]